MTHFTTKNRVTAGHSQPLAMLQAVKELLDTAAQVAGEPLGAASVLSIMQSTGLYNSHDSYDSLESVLEAVEEAGVTLYPELVKLIKRSPIVNVENALTIYIKTYGKGGGNNPKKLFFTILLNENQNNLAA